MTLEEINAKLSKDFDMKSEDVDIYINNAKAIVLKELYPFSNDETDIPDIYMSNVYSISEYLIAKIGAEGEVAHSENGISRTYSSSHIPRDLLSNIICKAGGF